MVTLGFRVVARVAREGTPAAWEPDQAIMREEEEEESVGFSTFKIVSTYSFIVISHLRRGEGREHKKNKKRSKKERKKMMKRKEKLNICISGK